MIWVFFFFVWISHLYIYCSFFNRVYAFGQSFSTIAPVWHMMWPNKIKSALAHVNVANNNNNNIDQIQMTKSSFLPCIQYRTANHGWLCILLLFLLFIACPFGCLFNSVQPYDHTIWWWFVFARLALYLDMRLWRWLCVRACVRACVCVFVSMSMWVE